MTRCQRDFLVLISILIERVATIYASAAATFALSLPYRSYQLYCNDMISPLLSFPLYCFAWSAAAVDYYLDPSTGRYFVEVPPEDDDYDDFSQ